MKGEKWPCTKSKKNSRIRTGSGSDRPEAQPESTLKLNDTDHDPLNLWPVATASGSDTDVSKHFLCKAVKSEKPIQKPDSLFTYHFSLFTDSRSEPREHQTIAGFPGELQRNT